MFLFIVVLAVEAVLLLAAWGIWRALAGAWRALVGIGGMSRPRWGFSLASR